MLVEEVIREALAFLSITDKDPATVNLDDLETSFQMAVMLRRRIKNNPEFALGI
jgi:hypothetical protein